MAELTAAIEAAELRMWPAHQQPDELIAARFRVAVTAACEEVEASVRAKIAEETEVEWASFLAHGNSAGRGYAYVGGHASREDAQSMADYLATPERPAWVGWRMVHPFQHDHPDPENAAAIARGHAVEAPESAPGAIAAPPEGERTSEGTEALTGREEET